MSRFFRSITAGWWLLVLWLAAAAIFLVVSVPNHATNYDELLVLTEGDWNVIEHNKTGALQAKTATEYARTLALAPAVTYAPGQFLLTYQLIDRAQPLSWPSVVAARIPSGIMAFAAVLLMAALLTRGFRQAPGLPGAIALGLLVTSTQWLIQGSLAYSYAAGPAAGLLGFMTVVWAASRPRGLGATFALLAAGLLPLFNYQVMVVLAGTALALGLDWLIIHRRQLLAARLFQPGGANEPSPFNSLLRLAGLLALLLPGMVWCYVSFISAKSDVTYRIPHWVTRYAYEPGKDNPVPAFLLEIVESHLISLSLWPYGVLLFSLAITAAAGLPFLMRVPRWQRLVLGASLCVFAVQVLLYFMGQVPLAPTRHTLFLLPFTLLIWWVCASALALKLGQLLNRGNRPRLALQRAGLVLWLVPAFMLISAFPGFIGFLKASKESFDPQVVARLIKQEATRSLAVRPYMANKAWLFLHPLVKDGQIELDYIERLEHVPEHYFLLISHEADDFGMVQELVDATPLYAHGQHSYRTEAFPGQGLWPNRMLVFALSKAQLTHFDLFLKEGGAALLPPGWENRSPEELFNFLQQHKEYDEAWPPYAPLWQTLHPAWIKWKAQRRLI